MGHLLAIYGHNFTNFLMGASEAKGRGACGSAGGASLAPIKKSERTIRSGITTTSDVWTYIDQKRGITTANDVWHISIIYGDGITTANDV